MKKALIIYSIQHTLYNITLPKIIIKIIGLEKKIVLLCKNKDEMNALDNLLWTFSQLSFIPHSTEEDDFNTDLQDIIIVTKLNKSVVNNRSIVVLCPELIMNKDVNAINEIFLITTENINLKTLNSNIEEKSIKLFIQNIDNSWKLN
jgi:DNA polymerase-3 subunit chi